MTPQARILGAIWSELAYREEARNISSSAGRILRYGKPNSIQSARTSDRNSEIRVRNTSPDKRTFSYRRHVRSAAESSSWGTWESFCVSSGNFAKTHSWTQGELLSLAELLGLENR